MENDNSKTNSFRRVRLRSLRSLVLSIVLPVAVFLLIVITLQSGKQYDQGVELMKNNLTSSVINRTVEIQKTMKDLLSRVVVLNMMLSQNESQVSKYLEDFVEGNESIHAILVAYDSHFLADLKAGKYPEYKLENYFGQLKEGEIPPLYCPIIYRTENGGVLKKLDTAEHYELREWYLMAKYLGSGSWSDPMTPDEFQILVCSYSMPFYHKGVLAGVVNIGFQVNEILARNVDLDSEYAAFLRDYNMCVLADNGKILYHSRQNRWRHELLYSLVSTEREEELFPAIDQILSGQTGFLSIDNWDQTLGDTTTQDTTWFVYAPIRLGSDWTLVTTFNQSSVLGGLRHRYAMNWLLGLLCILLLAMLVSVIAIRIYNPIIHVAEISQSIAGGDNEILLPDNYTKRKTVLGLLARNFNSMVSNLRATNTRAEAEETRRRHLESELNIARSIQKALLPRKEFFQNEKGFAIDATVIPATFVAGDFYDFWKLSDTRLVLLIADVSGKGAPSAMMMATILATIRQISAHSKTTLPGEIITATNEQIVKGNESNMFATLFFGIYDISTGILQYCNAGHNSPGIIRNGQPVEWLPMAANPIVGVFPEWEYTTEQIPIHEDEKLFMYTDGVSDTTAADGTAFGINRLEQLLTQLGDQSASSLIDSIIKKLNAFSGPRQQDDITILVLERKPDSTDSVTVRGPQHKEDADIEQES